MTAPTSHWPRRGLYAVTPEFDDSDALAQATAAVLRGGATMVQYRNKRAADASRRAQAAKLQALCADYGAAFVINDDIELAYALRADGVHLGEHDASVAQARARLGPTAIVGASCYDELDRARRAAAQGASYVAFGAFHPTTNKPQARRVDRSILQDARDLGVPCVAIGGITAQNAAPLIAAGADMIAVIGAVFDAPDIELAARRLACLFEDPS